MTSRQNKQHESMIMTSSFANSAPTYSYDIIFFTFTHSHTHKLFKFMILIYHLQSGGSCDRSGLIFRPISCACFVCSVCPTFTVFHSHYPLWSAVCTVLWPAAACPHSPLYTLSAESVVALNSLIFMGEAAECSLSSVL